MTTTGPTAQHDRYDKHVLFVRCQHGGGCDCNRRALAELHARWDADTPDLAALREQRERVELASRVPVIAESYQHPGPPDVADGDDEEPETDRDVLGACGAWIALAFCVLLILVLVAHNLWLWLT